MKGEIFHVNSVSPKVVFRSEDDYFFVINRLAVCADVAQCEILAYCVMSTHFHLIVRSYDVKSFIELFKRSTTQWLNKKYRRSGALFEIKYRKIESRNELLIGLNYVLKNPVHHGICETAWNYNYSSIGTYFREELQPFDFSENPNKVMTFSPDQLDCDTRRVIFGKFKINTRLKVLDCLQIDPRCFVKVNYAYQIYKTAKSFMWNMNKAIDEEVIMFNKDQSAYFSRMNSVELVGTILDIDVCGYIDSAILPKKYTELTESEIDRLWEALRKLGVSREQFDRCI